MTAGRNAIKNKVPSRKALAGLRSAIKRRLMTTATTGNLAEQASDKDKEKMEKRRALGRGLASLLPGPRVVAQAPPVAVPTASGHHAALPAGSNPVLSQPSVAVQA